MFFSSENRSPAAARFAPMASLMPSAGALAALSPAASSIRSVSAAPATPSANVSNPLTSAGAMRRREFMIPSASEDFSRFTGTYFLKSSAAGGVCCGVTHGALTPVDVVKTRIQLDPVKYNKGLVGGFRQVVAEEGAGALLTGFGPTVFGYFIQGWFKFGGVEFLKVQAAQSLGAEKAWEQRNNIYLGSAAIAEVVADIFLCPLEATRIRLVSNPSYASSMPAAMAKIVAEDGLIGGFYAGFGPILFKQVPYTMAKFAVQGIAAEKMYDAMGSTPDKLSSTTNVSVSLASGVIAGVSAAIISHPADTLLSKVNKAGAGGTGSIASRLYNIAAETGFVKLCTQGLAARCVMIGTLTAGQFGIFDTVMGAFGVSKFHFHAPEKK